MDWAKLLKDSTASEPFPDTFLGKISSILLGDEDGLGCIASVTGGTEDVVKAGLKIDSTVASIAAETDDWDASIAFVGNGVGVIISNDSEDTTETPTVLTKWSVMAVVGVGEPVLTIAALDDSCIKTDFVA
jgi:hypothetical protein